MSRAIGTLMSVALIVLLLFAFGQGDSSVVSAMPPKTPTPAGPTPTPPPPPPIPPGLRAGLRASNYGISPFPSPTWWVNSINSMASRFPGSVGEQVAVVVEVSGGGGRRGCWAHFPNPTPGTPWPNVTFDDVDLFEPAFDAFDQSGIQVWLQVEPARCDVPMLIDLLMLQYSHHSSVIGFGVDVEWYRRDLVRFGKPVTDAEGQAWVAQTTSYDPSYQVFLKHWLTEKMPPTYRTGLVFIDDSQGHGSLTSMVNEFSVWGQTFAPAPVGFQYGYQSDKSWWDDLADPPRDIGNALLTAIPNTRDLLWVDFTAYDIWPPE
ncbi:MAG: hypothetical protein L0332_12670 [Chloroflexi bacterium]|nr:hypothetical protein [Chloroflexota bacterium]MCI0644241.1 hypothetical protein [Chloroflexota bacterium]MCI0727560.1 hypothetical protein [Chloroflexota bacterium]